MGEKDRKQIKFLDDMIKLFKWRKTIYLLLLFFIWNDEKDINVATNSTH